MVNHIDSRSDVSYINGMISSYRRDAISKSLFRFTEVLLGAGALSIWVSTVIHLLTKLAFVAGIVLIFVVAIIICPAKNPIEGNKHG